MTDALHEEVVLMWASQTSKTQNLLNVLGFFVDVDPSPIMWVTVSLGEAEAFSRDRFEPFRRDNPRVSAKIGDPRDRDSANTITDKRFAGGRLLFRGGNSSKSLRGHPIRVAILDEVDAFDLTTKEGEPTKLAKRRTVAFWNRKIIYASTPGDKKTSRIAALYEASDRRRYRVRCPHEECAEEQILEWGGPATPYGVKWDRDPDGRHRPETARYVCRGCGAAWNDVMRQDAVAKGRWVAENPDSRVAGFWISELYSPFRRLEQTVSDFVDAKDDPEKLKEWQQQAMAEPWEDRGEAPEWEMLYRRREPYLFGKVPALSAASPPFSILTAGVDVQDGRLEFGLYAWNRRKESALVDYRVLHGDTRESDPWNELAALLAAEWPHEHGMSLPIRAMCVDRGGHRAPMVDAFVSRHPQPTVGPGGVSAKRPRTVVATVGRDDWKARVLGAQGLDKDKRKRAALIVSLGASYLKSEVQTWLKQPWPSDEQLAAGASYPVGAHHASHEAGEVYFRQLCAEQIVTLRDRGRVRQVFRERGGDRNEALDVFVLARAAAHMVGIDHFTERDWSAWEEMVAPPEAAAADPTEAGSSKGATRARSLFGMRVSAPDEPGLG